MSEAEAHGSILQDIRMGLFVPLALHTVVIHTAMVIARVATTYKIVGPKTTKANDLGPAFRYGGLKACCPKDLAVKI